MRETTRRDVRGQIDRLGGAVAEQGRRLDGLTGAVETLGRGSCAPSYLRKSWRGYWWGSSAQPTLSISARCRRR